MANKILEVKDLKQYFGTKKDPVKAIDGISFDVYDGLFKVNQQNTTTI